MRRVIFAILVMVLSLSSGLPQVQAGGGEPFTVFVPIIQVPFPSYEVPTVEPIPGCPPAVERTHAEETDLYIQGPAIAHLWYRKWFQQQQLRLLVPIGVSVIFPKVSGKSWLYADNVACGYNLPYELNQNKTLQAVNLSYLEQFGLAVRQ